MDCNEIRDRLPLFLHDDLPANEAASIKEHCATCPACRKEYASMQQLRRMLDALPTPRVEINLAQIYALATRLETMQYGDKQRWKATPRDVAALYSVCLGPHEKDKGGKP